MQIVIKSQTFTLDAAGARAVACELFDLLLTQFATDGFQKEYNEWIKQKEIRSNGKKNSTS